MTLRTVQDRMRAKQAQLKGLTWPPVRRSRLSSGLWNLTRTDVGFKVDRPPDPGARALELQFLEVYVMHGDDQ